MSPDLVRRRIESAAQRRDLHLIDGEALAAEIRALARDAQAVQIPMTELARLLHIDRSTLYRTYLNAT